MRNEQAVDFPRCEHEEIFSLDFLGVHGIYHLSDDQGVGATSVGLPF